MDIEDMYILENNEVRVKLSKGVKKCGYRNLFSGNHEKEEEAPYKGIQRYASLSTTEDCFHIP